MAAAIVTSKGQITIPADVRRALRVASGDRIEFVEIEPGRYEIIAAIGLVHELKGMFGPSKYRVSIEEMNEIIASKGSSAV
ncbi:MAG: AbrB/MazE/SpoVT family DNA-binding domain-containing protein [Granulosicoccus sp.]